MGAGAVGSRYTLALDAGTSRARCFVFASDGRVVAARSRAWQFVESGEAYSLTREWEPQALWHGICDVIVETIGAADVSRKDIGSVAVTSQRQALVFLDADGEELYAGPNLDLRALFEGAEIDETHKERIYRVTGHLPSFLLAPAKLRWFERHRPELFERVSRVLTLADWLVYRLTGEITNERTLAREAGLLDIGSLDRCHSLLSELGVKVDAAPLVDAGCVIGCVNSEAAKSAMLEKGIAVVAAGADTQCGLLGLGVCGVGEVGIVAGWSIPVQMITDVPLFSEDASSWTGRFLARDRWVAESSAGDVGNSFSWLVSLLCGESSAGFAEMDALAGETTAGSDGMQAILGNARMRFDSHGMRAGGFVFPVPLTLSGTGKGNFARAALESAAYSIRANLDFLESLSGQQAAMVALGGGMTRTRTFAPIVAEVLGREIRLSHTPDTSAMGAWLCAATAVGEFASLDDAAIWARKRMTALEPNPHRSAEYRHYYREWLELLEQLDNVRL